MVTQSTDLILACHLIFCIAIRPELFDDVFLLLLRCAWRRAEKNKNAVCTPSLIYWLDILIAHPRRDGEKALVSPPSCMVFVADPQGLLPSRFVVASERLRGVGPFDKTNMTPTDGTNLKSPIFGTTKIFM